MEKILYIFLIFSILSIGCSKEDDDITNIETNTTHLDSQLYGEWERDDGSSLERYYSFSSNGKFVYWYIGDNSGGYPDGEESGDWWKEGDRLILQYLNSNNTNVFDYNVSGNTLTLNNWTYIKQ